ncbi:VanZ family protein [Actinoplanes sp. TBRC 11911]|uniref:VanZ family protein n=1 Tax=Actinoplanes sp. TBRC 11911 TaxID=2729386 RepID=UPI00145F035F|nr:VanZ family protein [Actinoplanes sp. TBRC 11911]NMO56392.1 VanZ family protein [Actinoplanes sp. TBRC 11911]
MHTIPALPVLVPLGLVLMGASWLALRKQGPWRVGAAWLAVWYAVAVLGATMLPLDLDWGPYAGDPQLFRIILVPILEMRPDDFLLNTIMTLPLALVLRLAFGIKDRGRVVLIGFLASLTIETTQALLVLVLHGNRWADVNDLCSNTLGALLGWYALQHLMRYAAARRLVERASPRPEPVVDPAHR